jgi:hypothetical protein
MDHTQRNIHLIYVSEARVAFKPKDLHELLTKARLNNEALGVTGVLLYVDGFFFQVLEGDEGVVQTLYEKILADVRHTRVSKLIAEPIEEPDFADWSMGYAEVGRGDLARIPGLKDFFTSGSSLNELGAGRASALLEAFREGRWRGRIGI